MAAAADHVFVAGFLGFAVGVAGNCVGHAVDAFKVGFQPPEAAAGKVDGFAVHVYGFLLCGFVEGFFGADVGLWIGYQGNKLLALDVAFDHALNIAFVIEQRPARIDGNADVARDAAAGVDQRRRFRAVEAAIPLDKIRLRLFTQIAGRGQRDDVDAGKRLVVMPLPRFFERGQAERAPARPEFDERRLGRIEMFGGRIAVHILQSEQTLLQRTCRHADFLRAGKQIKRRRHEQDSRCRQAAVHYPGKVVHRNSVTRL